jgi:hypothetical protein
MARPTNTYDSSPLTLAVSPQVRQYLEDLTLKGTFGSNPAEAAKHILNSAIESMLNSGALERRKWTLREGHLAQA